MPVSEMISSRSEISKFETPIEVARPDSWIFSSDFHAVSASPNIGCGQCTR